MLIGSLKFASSELQALRREQRTKGVDDTVRRCTKASCLDLHKKSREIFRLHSSEDMASMTWTFFPFPTLRSVKLFSVTQLQCVPFLPKGYSVLEDFLSQWQNHDSVNFILRFRNKDEIRWRVFFF